MVGQSPLELLLNEETKAAFPINCQDMNGKSLLHYLAQRGSHESLDYVVKLYGVDGITVNLEDNFRNKSFAIAVELRHQ